MKKKPVRLIFAILGIAVFGVIAFYLTLPTIGEALSTTPERSNKITQPYTYPILPGSNEWRNFESVHEMIEACQIPEDLLTNMTTKALVQTVLDYPLLMDLLAEGEARHGFEVMISRFNGLQELSRRVDARDELEIQYRAISEENQLQGESSTPENKMQEILIGILIEQPEIGEPNEK